MSAAPARPQHHFDEAMLLDYAAGSLPEALSILVATHLALCPACRAAVADAEALGGALLESLDPQPLAPDALDRVLARIDATSAAASAASSPQGPFPEGPPPEGPPPDSPLPAALRVYLGDDPDALAWRPLAPGIDTVPVLPAGGDEDDWPAGGQVSLVRIEPGAVAPRHTHAGIEATVIVQGGFADDSGQYDKGDAWIVDDSVVHAPRGLPGEPCLCLVYLESPLKPLGGNHVASI